MKTKIDAAKICQLSGCYMVIANGNNKNPIKKIIKNKKCTWFLPRVSKLDARKQWIIGSIAPKGEVIIDEGAAKAINNGKSKTKVKDKVFIGSNSSLVAPVTLNQDSVVGAGSVITKNVKKKSLALTRSPQFEVKNYKRKKK